MMNPRLSRSKKSDLVGRIMPEDVDELIDTWLEFAKMCDGPRLNGH